MTVDIDEGKKAEEQPGNLDIEELKRTEQALRESEYKLRQVIDTVPGLLWSNAPDGELTYVNQRILDYTGMRLEDFKQRGWESFLHPDDLPETAKAFDHAIQTRTSYQAVFRLRRADGEYRWYHARAEPLRGQQGRIIQWYGLSVDIDERKKAEEALRESEARARSAFDGIAGLVSVLAPNGEFETGNRQFLEYFGRSREEINNWETNDTVHPEDRPRVAELFKKAMASGVPFQHELRLRRFDGEYRWFENRGVPIRDDSGRIVRWYVLLTDIEDRKRALAQLEQMQSEFAHMNRVSMMGELTASLSHEITQPIASARNNARAAQNFLDKQPPDLGEAREALSCVVGDADRAGDIVDRIRDHMKKAPPRKAQFDLNEAINEVIVLGRSAIIKSGVSVQTRISEGLFPVHGDRVQLQQVVLNLLLNAVEAMGSSETGARDLLISTEQDRTGVVVAVHDSGPGIHPEHLERVFNAFYTTKSSGMGMGLSICRSIIEAHGGRLWAEANEPRGAIFQFTLPAVP
jgi:PAS domain S-box-containing protein